MLAIRYGLADTGNAVVANNGITNIPTETLFQFIINPLKTSG